MMGPQWCDLCGRSRVENDTDWCDTCQQDVQLELEDIISADTTHPNED